MNQEINDAIARSQKLFPRLSVYRLIVYAMDAVGIMQDERYMCEDDEIAAALNARCDYAEMSKRAD